MIPTLNELHKARHQGNAIVGIFRAFCDFNSCCEFCDSKIRFYYKIKRRLEELQQKRILKICKKRSKEVGEEIENNEM